MEENKITELIDKLVMKTEKKESFSRLSEKQKAIAALDFLVGTTMRSGIEVFFEERHSFLFADALKGLQLTGAKEASQLFTTIIQNIENGKDYKEVAKELQKIIVVRDSGLIDNSLKEFVEQNYELLSSNLT